MTCSMAYGVLLGSVSTPEIERYRSTLSSTPLRSSRVFSCSHGVLHWVSWHPLGALLAEAIDNGDPLRPDLWHPRRPPVVVHPDEVQARQQQLEAAFRSALSGVGLGEDYDDWTVLESRAVIAAYRYAASKGEALVSAIQPPIDSERADRVVMPLPDADRCR